MFKYGWMGILVSSGCVIYSSQECDTSAAASVTVTVEDSEGSSIPNVVAVYSVDGGEQQLCDDVGGGMVCGWEQDGELEVTVTAEGYITQSKMVVIEKDTCHVIQRELAFTLALDDSCDDVDCTDIAMSSITVNISTEDGEEPENIQVTYIDVEANDIPPWSCEEVGENQYVCGWEEAGTFDIMVTSDNYQEFFTQVTVEEDCCHVISEIVNAELILLECEEEATVSVSATVSAEGMADGEIPEDFQLWFDWLEEDGSLELCTLEGSDLTGALYSCGNGQSGLFQLLGEADGYLPEIIEVEVEEDECGTEPAEIFVNMLLQDE